MYNTRVEYQLPTIMGVCVFLKKVSRVSEFEGREKDNGEIQTRQRMCALVDYGRWLSKIKIFHVCSK